MDKEKIVFLKQKANILRQHVIEMLAGAQSGHSAGSLGMADIFTAFYFHLLNHNPKQPDWADRDRLVLSNGHICPIQYAALAEAGYFPLEEIKTLRKIKSRLQGHPHRESLPGIETSSGPLGEGISQAIGMALAARMDKKDYSIFCLTSDGEHQEGNTWEAIMFASAYALGNLTVVIDRNHIQIDGNTEEVMPLEPLRDKYESFGWKVAEVSGHDIEGFIQLVEWSKTVPDCPVCIIAHTTPGCGVEFMENDYTWHGKPPNKEEAHAALGELKTAYKQIEQ